MTAPRLRNDEGGFVMVFAALGMLAMISVSMLAIDIGMMATARNQAQNSADAAALAGAVALVYNDFNDRSTSGPAVQSAVQVAQANQVMGSAVASDVTFPNDASGNPTRVMVNVFRSAARGNPLSTLVATYFGIANVNVTATATAEASPANAETCIKPFTVPDKWIEVQNPAWDTSDTFDAYDKKGNPLPNADIFRPASSPSYTGYNPTNDKGIQIVLKFGTGNNPVPSFYNAIDLPGSNGANDYRWNIGNCNAVVMQIGDLMNAKPGNMVGPTAQGIQDLIDQDPSAYWDSLNNRVVSTMSPSPRVGIVPLYDPDYYDQGKQNGNNAALKISNFAGFFFEGLEPDGDVVGRMVPVTGLVRGGAGTIPPGSFPRVIQLVQ